MTCSQTARAAPLITQPWPQTTPLRFPVLFAPSYRPVIPFKARHKTNTTCVPIAAFPALTASHFLLSFPPLISRSRTTFIDTNAVTTRQLYAPKFHLLSAFPLFAYTSIYFPSPTPPRSPLLEEACIYLRPPSGSSRKHRFKSKSLKFLIISHFSLLTSVLFRLGVWWACYSHDPNRFPSRFASQSILLSSLGHRLGEPLSTRSQQISRVLSYFGQLVFLSFPPPFPCYFGRHFYICSC